MPGGWIYSKDGAIKYRGWEKFIFARWPEIKRWALQEARQFNPAATTIEELANALHGKRIKP